MSEKKLLKFPELYEYYKSPDPNYEAVRKEVEEWRVRARKWLKEQILEVIKDRDRWDSELSAETNYRLLQERFEKIERKVVKFLEALSE